MGKAGKKGGKTVLVVDDEPLIRMDMAETLRRAGFDVEEASNSHEALRKLNGDGFRPGVLVTDVQMPGPMNGYGLAKHVHGLLQQTAIVIISGVVTPSPGDMPPNATFLAKPVAPESLLLAINDALLRA